MWASWYEIRRGRRGHIHEVQRAADVDKDLIEAVRERHEPGKRNEALFLHPPQMSKNFTRMHKAM